MIKRIYTFYQALHFAFIGYKSEKKLGYPRQEQPSRRETTDAERQRWN